MAGTAPNYSFKNAVLAKIKIADIVESTNALRTIDRENEEYVNLRDSIASIGLGKPILVRELRDPVTKEVRYGLIDGLQRKTAHQDLGMTEISAQIGTMEDADVVEAQIIMNAVKVETKPSEYTEALLRVLRSNPFLTESELAKRLNVSNEFLKQRLSLKNLIPAAKEPLDNGTLVLMNAYALAKLKPEQQEDMLNQAMTKEATEFVQVAHQLFKANKEGRRQGKEPNAEFVPIPKLHRLTTINEAVVELETSPDNSKLMVAIKQAGLTKPAEIVAYTLNWVRHMDPITVAAERAKREADKAAAKADREAKKAAELAAKQAALPAGIPAVFK